MGPFRVYGALKTFHMDAANSFFLQFYDHDESYRIPVTANYSSFICKIT